MTFLLYYAIICCESKKTNMSVNHTHEKPINKYETSEIEAVNRMSIAGSSIMERAVNSPL